MNVKENQNPWMMISLVLIGGIVGYGIGVWSSNGLNLPFAENSVENLEVQTNPPVENQENTVESFIKNFKSLPVTEVSEDDDATLGENDAPIVLIEFSDYQCPFCERFASESLPLIRENYVKTGKVKWVFRDYPLAFHANAKPAAEAAECAGEQDAYFEMHDLLFKRVNPETDQSGAVVNQGWSNSSAPQDAFIAYAKELGLNENEFSACLKGGKMKSEIEADFADAGKAGVRATPTFFINGRKLVGAEAYTKFAAAFDALLAEGQ